MNNFRASVMDNEEATLMIHSGGLMNSHDIDNILNHIQDQLDAIPDGPDIPRFRCILPENGLIKASCLNDSAVLFLVSIINNWPGQQLRIIYAEFFPTFYMTVFIPETGLNDGSVLSQFGRSNPELNTDRWTVIEGIEQAHGMEFRFEIDYGSFFYAENLNSILQFKNYQLEVVLTRGNIVE